MQLYTEKIIVNVSQLLRLIKEIRAQVLVNDYVDIKRETKSKVDEVKRENEHAMVRLADQYREALRLEEQAL